MQMSRVCCCASDVNLRHFLVLLKVIYYINAKHDKNVGNIMISVQFTKRNETCEKCVYVKDDSPFQEVEVSLVYLTEKFLTIPACVRYLCIVPFHESEPLLYIFAFWLTFEVN